MCKQESISTRLGLTAFRCAPTAHWGKSVVRPTAPAPRVAVTYTMHSVARAVCCADSEDGRVHPSTKLLASAVRRATSATGVTAMIGATVTIETTGGPAATPRAP